MKTSKDTHNLGSEWQPGSTYWYYLRIPTSGPREVIWEIDYDHPNKQAQHQTLTVSELPKHTIGGVPLLDVIAKKRSELGISN